MTNTNSINARPVSGTAIVGTGSGFSNLAYTNINTASTLAERDSNGNCDFNNVVETIASTVSAAQTISMTAASAKTQFITGSSTVQFNLPDATTLVNGWAFVFNNLSTGIVTVNQQNGSTLVTTVLSGGFTEIICTDNSTVQGTWRFHNSLSTGSLSGTLGTTLLGFVQAQGNLNSQTLTASQVVSTDGSKNLVSVPSSTSGFVLTSNGSSVPTFQSAALNAQSKYATFLVNPTAGLGTHTTIQAAVTAASSGTTIFIYAGTYTENISGVPAGITLSAYNGSVTIVGNFQYSAAGTITLNGINLQTNSNYALSVTGSAGSQFFMFGGGVLATNNTGVLFSATSGASFNLYQCICDVSASTGSALIDASSSSGSSVFFKRSQLNNSGSSATLNVINCSLVVSDCALSIPISKTGTQTLKFNSNEIDTSGSNTTCIANSGSNITNMANCYFNSGSATAINITAGSGSITNCSIQSTNTVAAAAGALTFKNNCFISSGAITATTAGTQGLIGLAPTAGTIGQQIVSTIASGSAVTLTTATAANITSISLTAGTWDVSCIGALNGTLTGTQLAVSINTTSATLGTSGDNLMTTPTVSTVGVDSMLSIPSYRIFITATTTVYLVMQSTFTVGTAQGYGRISATRVG